MCFDGIESVNSWVSFNSGPEDGGLAEDKLAEVVGCKSGPEDGGLEKDELAGVVGRNSGPEDGELEKDELAGVLIVTVAQGVGWLEKDEFAGVVGCNSGPKDRQLERDKLAGVVCCNSGPEDGGSERDEFSGNSGPENCNRKSWSSLFPTVEEEKMVHSKITDFQVVPLNLVHCEQFCMQLYSAQGQVAYQ